MKRDPRLVLIRGRWYLRFYDPSRSPKRKTISLGTAREDLAIVKLRRYTHEYIMGIYDPWLVEVESNPVLSQAVGEFLHSKQHLKPSSQKSLREVLVPFGNQLKIVPRDVTAAHVRAHIHSEGAAPRTIARRLTTMRSFFRFCIASRYADMDPTQGVERPRIYQDPPRFLTREEFSDAMHAAEVGSRSGSGRWTQQVIPLAVGTGIRLGSLVALRWDDVHEGFIHVPAGAAKTHGYRVPIFPLAASVLDFPRGRSPYVLGKKLRKDYVSHWFSNTVRDALGWPDEYTFHVLRHTFASWLVQGGTPLYTVSKWMGHSSIRVTERYAHLMPDSMLELGSRILTPHM